MAEAARKAVKDKRLLYSWKQVRQDGEDKYYFTSPQLKKKRKAHTSIGNLASSLNCHSNDEQHVMSQTTEQNMDFSKQDEPWNGTLNFQNHQDGNDCNDFENYDDFMKPSKISLIDAYVHQLNVQFGIKPLDTSFRSFVVQGVDEKDSTLKPQEFLFVHRCGKSFVGNIQWIYWCSCDESRAHLINSCSSIVNTSIDQFKLSVGPDCLHIIATQAIVDKKDKINYLQPDYDFSDHLYTYKTEGNIHDQDDSEIICDIGLDGAICIKANSGYGVIRLTDARHIICCTCRFNKTQCLHVQAIHHALKKPTDLIPDCLVPFKDAFNSSSSKNTRIEENYCCVSYKKIPFFISSEMLKKAYSERFNVSVEEDNAHLIPNLQSCLHCNAELSLKYERRAQIVLPNEMLNAKVYSKQCSSCEKKEFFDGQELGLINMGRFCVSYEVLRGFMNQFLLGRTTIYTQYCVLVKAHEEAGNQQMKSNFTYNHYRFSWYAFLDLLDMDLEQGFVCSLCKCQPKIVIMDATSLSFRKEFIPWQLQTKSEKKESKKTGRFQDRVFIKDKLTRTLLKKFTSTSSGISLQEYSELLEKLQLYAPSLSQAIKHASMQKQSTVTCLEPWSMLLQVLSSSSPVCALIPPTTELASLLKDMQSSARFTADPNKMAKLQSETPVLFKLIEDLAQYPLQALIPVLNRLLELSTAPFSIAEQSTSTDPVKPLPSTCIRELCFFPYLKIFRERGNYACDCSESRVMNGEVCNKRSSRHPTLLPGIFTLFCEHGICYGFQIMDVHESPNIPFTILYERFLKAPSVVIYDNACNLHQFCLNREPDFFRETRFFVDRFHWPNHSGCSRAYRLSDYPQLCTLNSQVVEQSNSSLKRIKSSVSYMNKKNFIKHCSLYLWYHNKCKS